MQKKLRQSGNLLDSHTGQLMESGYANEFGIAYNKEALPNPLRSKDWEYYLVLNERYGVGVTLAGLGMGSMFTVHLINLVSKAYTCQSIIQHGDLKMPSSPSGNLCFEHEEGRCSFTKRDNRCTIDFYMDNFGTKGQSITGCLTFATPPTDKMVLAVPYADPQYFYYNYKVNCMLVEGEVQYQGECYTFADGSMGTQDWGRGVWEPVNQWYWGSASGMLDGKPFGFNIGHGFGDVSKATENMIFYDGVCHKLDNIRFEIPGDEIGNLELLLSEEDYLKPWKFLSSDGRLDMDFYPIMDRKSGQQKGEYNCTQHQVFGHFCGRAILDDGKVLDINHLLGFAEKVGNDWRFLER